MQALVIAIFVREVSRITPLANNILLISGMMNLILTLHINNGNQMFPMTLYQCPTTQGETYYT